MTIIYITYTLQDKIYNTKIYANTYYIKPKYYTLQCIITPNI